jgi:hypothetical protein
MGWVAVDAGTGGGGRSSARLVLIDLDPPPSPTGSRRPMTALTTTSRDRLLRRGFALNTPRWCGTSLG